MVDATTGHELLSFMDAYLGYNQIPIYTREGEHTTFITDRGLYYYTIIPFGLKNPGVRPEASQHDIRRSDWDNHGDIYGRYTYQKPQSMESHTIVSHLFFHTLTLHDETEPEQVCIRSYLLEISGNYRKSTWHRGQPSEIIGHYRYGSTPD